MRRRLTVAILGVVIGTLLLTVAGSLLLVRRAAFSTAESELVPETDAIVTLLSTVSALTDQRVVRLLERAGAFDHIALVGVSPAGTVDHLASPLVPGALDVPALQQLRAVSGNVGNTVFVAHPVFLNTRQMRLLAPGIPPSDQAVLVVTRHVANPVNGVLYFLAVGGAVLVVGAVVAALLARRISAPLVRSVEATRQIAAGNLAARVPTSSRDDPELVELADAINTMSANLSRAHGLERQFLMSVSHELRTPLTSIRGYADAVAEGATTDVAGAIAVIGSEARRLERLVRDLLDLARLDARQFSLDMERVDCSDVVAAVAEGFRVEADTLGIEVLCPTPAGSGLWVDADPDRLGQVVANLIENALKFATDRVEAGAAAVGSWHVVWVVDDGPGIAADDLPHVFERHYRSDRVAARKAGAGLGLAIVAELAAAMGSVVDVDSPVVDGHGARMALWLQPRSAPAGGPLDHGRGEGGQPADSAPAVSPPWPAVG
ncbi:MAG TPA: HAMP domain-containing sensor histidine kinase [Acidimicrobiales bacterium]|nr:HAMP domain-containing sensor histidine kinase [Acidimicrobiales bacterium]